MAERDRLGEFVRTLNLVELLLNRLPQRRIVDIFQDEEGFGDFPGSGPPTGCEREPNLSMEGTISGWGPSRIEWGRRGQRTNGW